MKRREHSLKGVTMDFGIKYIPKSMNGTQTSGKDEVAMGLVRLVFPTFCERMKSTVELWVMFVQDIIRDIWGVIR